MLVHPCALMEITDIVRLLVHVYLTDFVKTVLPGQVVIVANVESETLYRDLQPRDVLTACFPEMT